MAKWFVFTIAFQTVYLNQGMQAPSREKLLVRREAKVVSEHGDAPRQYPTCAQESDCPDDLHECKDGICVHTVVRSGFVNSAIHKQAESDQEPDMTTVKDKQTTVVRRTPEDQTDPSCKDEGSKEYCQMRVNLTPDCGLPNSDDRKRCRRLCGLCTAQDDQHQMEMSSTSAGEHQDQGLHEDHPAVPECADKCPVGLCETLDDALKEECADCVACKTAPAAVVPCADKCKAGMCDTFDDAFKPDCADCVACKGAVLEAHPAAAICADTCPVGVCDTKTDASKPECTACSACHAAAACADKCVVGVCDSKEDALTKPECAECRLCHQAVGPCGDKCPVGVCDSEADASKPDCAECVTCHAALAGHP